MSDGWIGKCPGCGESVEQDYVEVRVDGHVERRAGRWMCLLTAGCEYGPPVRPDRCTCPAVDVRRLSEAGSRFLQGRDPDCPMHGSRLTDDH